MKTFTEYLAEMSSSDFLKQRINGPEVHADGTKVTVRGVPGKVVGHETHNGNVTRYHVLHDGQSEPVHEPAVNVQKA